MIGSNAAQVRARIPSARSDRRKFRGSRLPVSVSLPHPTAIDRIAPMLREVRKTLAADALTVAVRHAGNEWLIVCTMDGEVRPATGALALGLVGSGPSRLTGGAGILQAIEGASLFGFVPTAYLGAPFVRSGGTTGGGVAAWTRRPRRWAVAHRSLLRRLASACALALTGPVEQESSGGNSY